MIKRVTYDQFRAWLEAFRPGQVIGKTTSPCHCPMANYTGYRATYVSGSKGYGYLTPTNFHSCTVAILPKWAYRFMLAVDTSGLKNITARRALKILEACR